MTDNIVWHHGRVERSARAAVTGGEGATVWLTGLSGSGKSTIASALEVALIERGRAVYVLDGDNVRFGLNADLGFSREDRNENVRRVGEVARLMADAGIVAIVPLISPYVADRDRARAAHADAGIPFYEVFIDTPLELCEQRDPKGLYARARRGEITQMTGIDDPYEPPPAPDLVVRTDETSVEAAVQLLLALLGIAGG